MLLSISLSFMMITCEKEPQVQLLKFEIKELICQDGQRIFEGRLLELGGIKTFSTNIKTQKAEIRYWDNQIKAIEVEKHLSDFGFTIDGVQGNNIARKRLPSCCLNED